MPPRKHRLNTAKQARVMAAWKELTTAKAKARLRVRPVLVMQVEQTLKRCLQVQTHALSRAPTVGAQPSVVSYLAHRAARTPLPKTTFAEMRRLLDSKRLNQAERVVLLIVQMTATTDLALHVLLDEHAREPKPWLDLWLHELQRSVVYAESLAALGDDIFLDGEDEPVAGLDPFQHRGGAPLRPGPRTNKNMN